MVRFDKISVTEKRYPFVKATADGEYMNGTFGTITDGVFKASATGFYVIMHVEKGDDAKSADYTVKKGEQIRVADLSKVDGEILNITSEQLPAGIKEKDKAVSKADGTLTVPGTAPTAKYLEVTEVTRFGVNAKVVVA